eukprot:COSAG01_NODE_58504_length_305_cov_1.592233_1_plen_44_part_01
MSPAWSQQDDYEIISELRTIRDPAMRLDARVALQHPRDERTLHV